MTRSPDVLKQTYRDLIATIPAHEWRALMRGTVIHYVSDAWADLLKSHRHLRQDGSTTPARFYGHRTGFFQRFQAAWLVFTGKADALMWPQDYERP